MIDLRRLHVLRAVVLPSSRLSSNRGTPIGTVTAAARALHFTTSAASQQIRRLARDLRVDLLEPQAELDLRAEHEPAGSLRVSGFPVAVPVLRAPMAVRLHECHPRLSVRIQEAGIPDSFDLLFEGETDLAVVEATPHNPPLSDARFDRQPILDDPFGLVVPRTTRRPGASASTCPTRRTRTGSPRWRTAPAAPMCCPPAGRPGVVLIPRPAQLTPHLPITRVRCTGNPHGKLLTCTRRGARERPAVAAALQELRELAPTAVA